MKQELKAKRKNTGAGCRYWTYVEPVLDWELDHRTFGPSVNDRRDGEIVWNINDIDFHVEIAC